MKPAKLVMSAFGPYAEAACVDFRVFGESGLFLVTGDTGAGKTTIFDGICYALFDEASGSLRDGTMMRSDFARPETKTFVELEFEYRGESYLVRRNPRYERPKARGEGMTTENADAELTLPDPASATGTRVVSGSRKVTDEIVRILGVDRSQFTQIAMLAQGDFMKILVGDGRERSDIFRRIFGTARFERFQQELKSRAAQQKAEHENLRRAIAQQAADIDAPPEHPELAEFERMRSGADASLRIGEIMKQLDAMIAADEAANVRNEASRLVLRQERTKLEIALDGAVEAEQKRKRCAEAAARLAGLSAKTDEMAALGARLTAAESAIALRPLEERMNASRKKAEETARRMAAHRQRLENGIPERARLEAEFAAEQALEPAREKMVADLAALKAELPRHATLAERLAQLAERDTELTGIRTRLLERTEAREKAAAREAGLSAEMLSLQDADVRAEQAKTALEAGRARQTALDRALARLNAWKTEKRRLERAQQEYLQAGRAHEAARDAHARMDDAWMAGQAGILAARLLDGQPCPVCGATDHPAPAAIAEAAPDEASLKQAKAAAESARETARRAGDAAARQRAVVETQWAQLFEESLGLIRPETDAQRLELLANQDAAAPALSEELEQTLAENRTGSAKEVEGLAEALGHRTAEATRRAALAKEEAALKTLRAKLVDEAEKALKEQAETVRVLEGLRAQTDEIRSQLRQPDRATAERIARETEAALARSREGAARAEQALKTCRDELARTEAALSELERSAGEEIAQRDVDAGAFRMARTEKGLTGESAWQSANADAAQAGAMRQTLEAHREALVKANAEAAALAREAERLPSADPEQLRLSLSEARTREEEAERISRGLYSRLTRNRGIAEALTGRSRLLVEAEARYAMTKSLSDTANGDLAGRQRLTFERYIQAAWFNRVLELANERFSYMTGGRYALLRREEASDLRGIAGLELDVMDQYTGKARSVKSLSGGESFKASLSLALGLSDMIQRHAGGIRLDTMFVDEGFGTLDQESLEQSIDILDQLTGGNRLVGIISHVAELRDRIDRKIVVSKGTSGSSVACRTI